MHLHLRSVPVEDVQAHFAAADLVVLPYRKTLNSAVALLALSFDRPVLVPNAGSMAELQREVGAEWVLIYEGSEGALTGNDLRDARQTRG